ncbi:MAG: tRNA pseudouridine(38-40) synthase TruA [Clostridiales bacterium 43-6]|nr:MAG: tRNA pseudouridine(38-40) synthase TruA [Clostridiales bacterium 43-6]
MIRYKVTLCFIGTNYHGWQVQKNAVAIQQVLQDKLQILLGTRPGISGCSRTDTGVHANMYCFHMDLDSEKDENKLLYSMNALLPRDIAVKSVEKAGEGFHARYSVVTKEYIYKIWNGRVRNPFYEGLSIHIRQPLDMEKMKEASYYFLGKHDFSAFCSAGSDVLDTTREIKTLKITKEEDLVTITVEADGFLYNMVRIIVGTLLFVSEGKIKPGDIPDIIASKNRRKAGKTAPAKGLTLNHIHY